MERFYKKSTADFYTLVFLLLLSILTITLDYKYNQITYIRSIITDLIVYPIDQLSSMPKSLLNDAIRESSNLDELENTIALLKKENMNLKIKLQELASLKDENTRLRKITKQSLTMSKKQTIVKVINNAASPNKRILAIDKGQKHGIFVGQNVIGVNGLVGQIIETNFLSSKVILISEPTHTTPGQINRTGEKVLINGSEDSQKLSINYAKVGIDIKPGDIISTSGIAGRFKSKIPIGKISKVYNNPDRRFSEIDIEPFENIGNMSELSLIWDYMPQPDKEEVNE